MLFWLFQRLRCHDPHGGIQIRDGEWTGGRRPTLADWFQRSAASRKEKSPTWQAGALAACRMGLI